MSLLVSDSDAEKWIQAATSKLAAELREILDSERVELTVKVVLEAVRKAEQK